MTFTWTHENTRATVECNHGATVTIYFGTDGYPSDVDVNGTEFHGHDDALMGLFVGIGERVISLRELSLKAMYTRPADNESERQRLLSGRD